MEHNSGCKIKHNQFNKINPQSEINHKGFEMKLKMKTKKLVLTN